MTQCLQNPSRMFLNIECQENLEQLDETKKVLVIGCSLLSLGTVGFYLLLFLFSKNIDKSRSKYYSKQVSVAAFTVQAYVSNEVWTNFLLKRD